jgi:hypothetical protein
MGFFKLFALTSLATGAIFVFSVGLVSLGMPQEAIQFIHSLRWLTFFWAMGFLAWIAIVVLAFVLFMVWFSVNIWPHIARKIANSVICLSDSRVITHTSDFLKGICKPVEIID